MTERQTLTPLLSLWFKAISDILRWKRKPCFHLAAQLIPRVSEPQYKIKDLDVVKGMKRKNLETI